MKVFVAIYEHKHGFNTRVFKEFKDVQKWKDEIGAEGWASVSDDPQPEEPCGDEYFDLAGDSPGNYEFFTWDLCPIE